MDAHHYDPFQPRTAVTLEFERIRREISDITGRDPWHIEPGTRLTKLLSKKGQTELIRRLRAGQRIRESQAKNLKLNKRLPFHLIVGVLCFINAWFLILVVLFVIGSLLTWSAKNNLPWKCRTVYELALHEVKFSKEDVTLGLWPREEISAKVRWIIALNTGYPFDEITEDTLFVDL